MKLYIDNLDMAGPRDYTRFLRGERGPLLHSKLNCPDRMEVTLIGEREDMLVPVAGARIELVRSDGSKLFTGFLAQPPTTANLGDGSCGSWHAYTLTAIGDEFLLDRKPLAARPDYVKVRAGELVRELVDELCPHVFDSSNVGDGEELCRVACGGARQFSEIAAQVAESTRSVYRIQDGAISLQPVGSKTLVVDEHDRNVDTRSLQFSATGSVVNRATVLGGNEPASYVKDRFCGDGYELAFPLSNLPFLRTPYTVLEEEFAVPLADYIWDVRDDAGKLRTGHGQLLAEGGTGGAEECNVALKQPLELGGAWQLQHGEVTVESGNGWIGGLFEDEIDTARCIAGFRITDSSGQRQIQPFIAGVPSGAAVTVRGTCRYALSTRVYASEAYRLRPTFYSSKHSCGTGLGGGTTAADVRIVLECREIDFANPTSLAQPATVLFDDVLKNAPAACRYVLLASEDMHGSTNFARIRRMPEVLVRSALPGETLRTRLVGALSEGAECSITTNGTLYFYTANPPAPNETIVAEYRTANRSAGSATDEESIVAHAHLLDDGIRASVATLVSPVAHSSEDCALAAQIWLENSANGGWSGEYSCWSDALPNGRDVLPGDAVQVIAPSRDANFTSIVREVQVEAADLVGERERIHIHFADDGADPIALQLTREQSGYEWPRVIVDAAAPPPLPDLNAAQITAITSTTLTIDVGVTPPASGGIEVRRSDTGWSPDIDRNLVGRFTARIFTLPRLGRNQQYCFRQYDASVPVRYSRHTTILYVDQPL